MRLVRCGSLKGTGAEGAFVLAGIGEETELLAEATTAEISKEKLPQTLDENRVVARQGGEVAGNARKEIEVKTGKKVITSQNAKQLGRTKKLEPPKQ